MEESKPNQHVSSLAEASANVWRQGWFKAVVIIMVLALTFIVGANYGNCRNERGNRKMGQQHGGMMNESQGGRSGMGLHRQGGQYQPHNGNQERMIMHNMQNTDCPYHAPAPTESNQQAPDGAVPITTGNIVSLDRQ